MYLILTGFALLIMVQLIPAEMYLMLTGLAIFIGVHLIPMARETRAMFIEQLGELGYKAALGVTSILGLFMLIAGFGIYRETGYYPLWYPPTAMRHVAFLINLPIFVLILAAYLPGRIQLFTRHPMLIAIKLWAVAHLLANGDLGDTIIFAAFFLWASVAHIAARRRDRVEGVRARNGAIINDLIAGFGGLALYALMLIVLHPVLIGVKLVG